MAGPISHVVYAKLALQSFLDVADKKRFIIGTLFPDIRYLGHINRHATHATDVKLADVRAESDSFKAGMLFHALVDETRHAFVTNHHAYSILSKSRFTTIALKMCEDKQLHSKIKNWQHYTKILDEFPVALTITAHDLQKLNISQDFNNNGQEIRWTRKVADHISVGAELFPQQAFNIRFGYNVRRGNELAVLDQRSFAGLSAGFGIKISSFRFDYAHVRYHNSSNVNMFGVTLDLIEVSGGRR